MTPPAGALQERERLRVALDGYAADDLKAMLDRYSPGAGATRRKAERVAYLVDLLTDEDYAHRTVGSLSPLGRRFLGIVREYGRTSLPALFLAGVEPGQDEAPVQHEIEELLAKGLLLLEERDASRKASIALSEALARLRWVTAPQAVIEALPAAHLDLPLPAPLARDPARVEASAFAMVRRDLYLALRFLKTNGLRLTRAGDPHRADLRKLLAALRPGKATRERGAGDDELQGRLPFLLRLLIEMGLVRDDGEMLWASDETEAFLNAPELVAARRLYQAWLDLPWDEFARIPHLALEPWSYHGPTDQPSLQQLTTARRSVGNVLAALASAGDQPWIASADIADYLRRTDPEFLIPRLPELVPGAGYYNYYSYNTGYYQNWQVQEQLYYRGLARADARGRERRLRKDQDWQEVEGGYVTQALVEPLHWLGLVEIGYQQPVSDASAIRLTPLGLRLLAAAPETDDVAPAGTALVVQPNFEILVLDALANLELLGRLDGFAEQQSLDRAAVYRLTRPAFVRGLAAGWSEDRVVTTLEAGADAPLPQNVRRTLRDWTQEYERIQLHREATLLEVAEANALDQWLADPDLAPLVLRRLTPTTALLRPLPPVTLERLLDRHEQALRFSDYAVDEPQILDLNGPGTIVVSAFDDEPYLQYHLAQFADRAPASAVPSTGEPGRRAPVTYTVSAASLARARAVGLTIDDILSFLGYKVRVGLTQDDIVTLRGWAGYYAPFRYASVRAVELPPTANWGDLSRIKALRPLILRVLSASLALVHEEHWAEFEAALTARGITLSGKLLAQPPAEKRSAAQLAANRLGLSLARDLAPKDEPPSGAAPKVQRLTGRALTDFLEEALDAQAPVLIEYRKAADRRTTLRTVEPRALEVRGGAYYLHAFCRLRQEERDFRLNDIVGVALAGA